MPETGSVRERWGDDRLWLVIKEEGDGLVRHRMKDGLKKIGKREK